MTTNLPAAAGVAGYGVVVTGGASGLGLAYAEALAENGARVTLLDLDRGAGPSRGRGSAARARCPRRGRQVTDHAALERRSTRRRQTLWPPGCGVRQCRCLIPVPGFV